MAEITMEQWEEKYKPQINHLIEDAEDNVSFGGIMYETYDIELDYVVHISNTEPNRVWTYVSGDGDAIVPGYHLCNRIGYFICEVPFEDSTDEEWVSLEDDEDMYDEHETEFICDSDED